MPNKAPLLLILGALSLLAGCGARRGIPTTAQVRGYIPAPSESRSPAGDWVATSFTRPGEAFGGGYFLTDVLLKSPDSQVPTQVLEFSHEQPAMDLEMQWTTPKHLTVKYRKAGIVSNLTECAGVGITVQMLAN